jgi:NAD(P)H-nitrite reductase large subunit
VTRAEPAVPFYKKLVLRAGADGASRLVGAILLGDTAEGSRLLQLIGDGAPVEPDALTNPPRAI